MIQVKAKDGMNDYLDDKWDVRSEINSLFFYT